MAMARPLWAAILLLPLLAACGGGERHRLFADAEDADFGMPMDAAWNEAGDSGEGIDAGPTWDASAERDASTDAMRDVESDGPEISLVCGDTIRDPATEECDDGPGAGEDSCAYDCRSRALGVVAIETGDDDAGVVRVPRDLGNGAHSVGANNAGFVVAFEEDDGFTHVSAQRFDQSGRRRGEPVDVSAGGLPSINADPVVASLGEQGVAFAWVDRNAGTPDIVLRSLDLETGSLGARTIAHASTSGTQSDPDVLWTGSELVVAWSDLSDIFVRSFGPTLVPHAAQAAVSLASSIDTSPVLTSFNDAWAVAFRAIEQGSERVRVVAGAVEWLTAQESPAPYGERPALVQLDASHMLLMYSVATDPGMTGVANVNRLRVAVLSTGAPGQVASLPLLPLSDTFGTGESLVQRRPRAVRVGDRVYIAWEQARETGDPLGSDVLLQEVVWSGSELMAVNEWLLSHDATNLGDQHNPALAASPLFPEGALIGAWEDHGDLIPTRPTPDVWLSLRPSPIVELPPADQ